MNAPVPAVNAELRDSARRMADAVNVHVMVANTLHERIAAWVAVRLSDGRPLEGNPMFESRQDAVNAVKNLSRGWCFVLVGADTMQENEAIVVLQRNRQAFASGFVFGHEIPVIPMRREDMALFIPKTIKGLFPERRGLR